MKQFGLISLLLIFCFSGNAQTILLKQDVNNDTIIPDMGPNRKHYNYVNWNYGLIVGPADEKGADIEYGRSYFIQTGYGYKRQVGGGFYAIGFDVNINVYSFSIKQDSSKIVFGNQQHEKERLMLYNGGITFYNRFNFVKRGDHLGKYLDLGAYGDWAIMKRYSAKDEPNDGSSNLIRTVARGMENVNNLQYGLMARLGVNGLSIFGRYRMSDLFNDELGPVYPELPRFVVGVSFTYND
jgi:hypothetical protein